MKKGFLVSTVAGAAMFTLALTGCSSTAPAPSASASPSASSTATASASVGPTVPANFGKNAPAGKPVAVSTNKYLQSTIANDDPAMILNPSTVDTASTSPFSQEDLREAQAVIVKFTAEEGIDSTLNGNVETVDQWWAKNKTRFAPKYQKEIYDTLKAGRPFVLNEAWQKQYKGKYKYITSPDKTRVYDRNISVKTVWSPAAGTVAVQMDVSYKMPVVPGVGKTGTGTQTTSGTMTYSVSKDTSGKWLIDGFQHETKTIEG